MIGKILKALYDYVFTFVGWFGLNKAYTYGLAIILFTAIIRILLLPINIKQTKSQAKLQEVQPLMQEIQKKYKNDPQKQQAELSKLYKESGANPLGGCLPLLIQMPIFFAMYALIRQLLPELNNLTEKGFTFLVPDLTKTNNYVLAISSAVISYFSMAIMMPKNDNPQAKTANTTNMVMTVFSGFITLTVPAALGVYWVSNSFFQLAQNLFMKKAGLMGKKVNKDEIKVQSSKDIVKEVSTDKITSKGKNKGKK